MSSDSLGITSSQGNVSVPSAGPFRHSDSNAFEDSIGASAEQEPFVNNDVPRLLLRWQNEKYAPELLPFDKEVVENVSEVVEYQSETLDEERADGEAMDPNNPSHGLRCLDVERVKYVLRDYLRIRLVKMLQFPQYYLEPAGMAFLSEGERIFLRDSWELKAAFFEHRLLGALPPAKQGLDDQIDLLNMVRQPELDRHVYARIVGEIGTIDVPPTYTQSQDSAAQAEPLELVKGNTYLLRYNLVRKFLVESTGQVELV